MSEIKINIVVLLIAIIARTLVTHNFLSTRISEKIMLPGGKCRIIVSIQDLKRSYAQGDRNS